MQRVAFIAAAILLLASLPATAQEEGQVGLVTGYPATIGLIWHASDRVAIRPDVSVTHSSSESQSGGSTVLATSGWGVGFDVAALVYLSKSDNVRTYCSPQFGYTRTTTRSEPSAGLARSESTANTYSVAGSFGAQYSATHRFSVFGEFGFAYRTGDSTFTSSTSLSGLATGKTTTHGFGTRTAVGIVLYFK
jgi:hypothetical protein